VRNRVAVPFDGASFAVILPRVLPVTKAFVGERSFVRTVASISKNRAMVERGFLRCAATPNRTVEG
jgi:hypothetical protein